MALLISFSCKESQKWERGFFLVSDNPDFGKWVVSGDGY